MMTSGISGLSWMSVAFPRERDVLVFCGKLKLDHDVDPHRLTRDDDDEIRL